MDLEKIKKTIRLLKKCYHQPLLFHILHNHLSFLVKNMHSFPQGCFADTFSKILISSTNTKTYVNLDNKIVSYLKASKHMVKYSAIVKYKVKIILYYLINQPYEMFNKFICFELICNYSSIKELEVLVASYLQKYALASFFEISIKKKMPADYISLYFQKSMNFGINASIKNNTISAIYDQEARNFNDFVFSENLQSILLLESLVFFAKFVDNIDKIRTILPSNDNFILYFKSFLKRKTIESSTLKTSYTRASLNYSKMLIREDMLLSSIRREFWLVCNKKEYLDKVRKLVDELERTME